MIRPGTLVLHKNRLGIASPDREGKILVELPSSEFLRLREKDVIILPADRLDRLPQPRQGGDFDTAWTMLEGLGADPGAPPLGWRDFAELVFGDSAPDALSACALAASGGSLFRIAQGLPLPFSAEERLQARKKEEERGKESQRREDFIAWFRSAIQGRRASQSDPGEGAPIGAGALSSEALAERGWTKYLAEMENLALGKIQASSLASALGIRESSEAAHRALVGAGIWKRDFNPWPQRAGCALKPPKASFPEEELPGLRLSRADFSSHPAYAIDAPWSADPDDAVSTFDGLFWVHVADPAAYIPAGAPSDAEALERGATLYLPERIIPMLPDRAVEMLGLGLAETSKALSFGVRLDEDGRIVETRITPSLIRVTRLSYEEADARLVSGDELLRALDAAASARQARRRANGAVDIRIPEVSMTVRDGLPRFVPIQLTRSAEIVREMMLMAGEAAASWAIQRRIPFVYSVQQGGSEGESVDDAGQLRLSMEYKKRKSMRAGGFGTEHLAHRGLGLPYYSQVTSPLRRYQDLLAHMQIRLALASSTLMDEDEIGRRSLIASRGAASTRQAERESRLHWTIRYLEENPEWAGEATILEVRDGGAWILVPSFGLECRLASRIEESEDAVIRVKPSFLSLADLEIAMELAL